MPIKVKRGLGLLVASAIGWLLGLVLLQVPADGAAEWPVFIGLLLAIVMAIGGLVVGLAILAVGLLRD